MDLKITSGFSGTLLTGAPNTVLHTGWVHSFGRSDIVFHLADDFIVAIRVTPSKPEEVKIEASMEGPHTLVLNFWVSVAANGFGWVQPQQIGKLDERQLLAAFRLDSYGDPITSFAVKYTFYLGEADK